MKNYLLTISLLLIGSVAAANTGEDIQKRCESSEIKALLGPNGSCRALVVPKEIKSAGQCMGTLFGTLPCMVSFISVEEGSAMNITCGNDPKTPDINQDMEAEAFSYNVALILKNSNGVESIISDSKDYQSFSNLLITLSLEKEEVAGVLQTKGQVLVRMQNKIIPMDNVICN